MAMTRAEVRKKPGYEAYRAGGKDRSWQKDLVAIRVADMPQDGEGPHVVMAIDGIRYVIPRGFDVKVPKLIADSIKDKRQHQWAIEGKNPMHGMNYLGYQHRFYVIPLGEDKAGKAVEIKPMAPLSAHDRLAVHQTMLGGARDDLEARAAAEAEAD